MTFTQLQARATLLSSFGGWTNVSPAPDWAALINQAWAIYSWETECVVTNETVSGGVIANQAEYTLASGPYKAITDVYLDSTTALFATSERAERQRNPDWYYAPASTPTRYLLMAAEKLRLVPAPPSSGSVLFVRGITEGAVMTIGTDKPTGCPDRFHEGIALIAATLMGKVYPSNADDLTILNAYRLEAEDIMKKHRRYLEPFRNRGSERRISAQFAGAVPL